MIDYTELIIMIIMTYKIFILLNFTTINKRKKKKKTNINNINKHSIQIFWYLAKLEDTIKPAKKIFRFLWHKILKKKFMKNWGGRAKKYFCPGNKKKNKMLKNLYSIF